MANPKVAELQTWLNTKGAGLVVDGVGGDATWAAIITVFQNKDAKPMTDERLGLIAVRLGGTVKQIKAVSAVEAPRGGWDRTGLLTCLYERHYGWRRWQIKIPFLSDPKPGGYTIDIDDNGINDSWEKVADAACRFGFSAFECASWGKFQIMGAWWEKLGYRSVVDFVYALSRDEYAHYDALCRYIQVFRLTKAFQKISDNPADCVAFAKGYNGAGYAKYSYHTKIAREMR